ncbi:hypothetical protein N7486_000601 [Penicillium sp. IBT 16267x]|nr:hypothetical protein N7486_000601 [Penicillium sp. IBT 16267x]
MSALLFAICYAAVVTMPTKECWHEFNESKDKTLQRYRTGVENHLTLANDRQSSEIIVLQALMIYLICGRCDEAGPDVRDLTPVAINIAQKNGLHEDNPRLSFFDLEMRRRIWWHIYILDVRTAENFGTDPHIHEPSTRFKLPLNINDTILHPDMTEKPQTNSGKTEMLFSLVRFKISDFARRMVFSNNFCQQNGYKILSPLEKCKAIDEFRDQIEKEYLSYCDNNIPLDHITLTSSRLILVKLKLSVSKPQDRQNQHILSQECFRNTCMDVMEGSRLLRLYEKGKEWLWLFQTYLEWDALIYLFINLSLVPTGDGVSAAWRIADDVYEYWKNRGDVRLNGRWEQIEEFRSQALIAKDMFRYAPSLSVPEVSRRNGDGSIQLPGDNPGHQIGEEHEWAFSNAATALPEASSLIDMPTSGTGCQWSASILERYFELLDTEQSHAGPWL